MCIPKIVIANLESAWQEPGMLGDALDGHNRSRTLFEPSF